MTTKNKRAVSRKRTVRRARPRETPTIPDMPTIVFGDTNLTPRQQLFAQEYIVDFNATQSALRAGYSPATAHKAGHDNLNKPHVAKAIKEAMNARVARTAITADRVLQELARIGFVDPGDFYEDNGDLVDIGSLGRDQRAALQQVKIEVERDRKGKPTGVLVKQIRFQSKLKALELIAKHLGIMQERFEILERREEMHTFRLDTSTLKTEELEILLKLVGARYLKEEDVCPGLPKQ